MSWATIKVAVLRTLIDHVQAYLEGDYGHFARMVDGRSRQILDLNGCIDRIDRLLANPIIRDHPSSHPQAKRWNTLRPRVMMLNRHQVLREVDDDDQDQDLVE